MSIFWKSDRFGYDGDNLHDRREVEADLDRQLAEVREQALAEYDRLTADEETDTK